MAPILQYTPSDGINGTSQSAINGKLAEQKKTKPLHELLTSEIANIYVGPEQTLWPLHANLLSHYSKFFASKFDNDDGDETKSCALPDEDNNAFQMLVSWLYSHFLQSPADEKDIGPLLELYLLSDKLQIDVLSEELVESVRQFYHDQNAYPGLRRVQYIYANTEDDNLMREMMVSSVARYLTLSDSIPAHWNKALRKNGDLAVDVIRAIQEWHLESRTIPDVRDGSMERGRAAFSRIENGHVDESFSSTSQADAISGAKSSDGEQEAAESSPTTSITPTIEASQSSSPTLPQQPKPPDQPPKQKPKEGINDGPSEKDSGVVEKPEVLGEVKAKGVKDGATPPATPNVITLRWDYVLMFAFVVSQIIFATITFYKSH